MEAKTIKFSAVVRVVGVDVASSVVDVVDAACECLGCLLLFFFFAYDTAKIHSAKALGKKERKR